MKNKKNTITPLHNYVLISPEELTTTTKSGIILTTVQEKPQRGKIVSLGKGVKEKIKVGDIVIYKKWGGIGTQLDGVELLIVKEEDLLAIVEM